LPMRDRRRLSLASNANHQVGNVMSANPQKHAIGLFANPEQAEEAFNALKASNFPMEQVSVVAKHAQDSDQIGGAPMREQIGQESVGLATRSMTDLASGSALGAVLVGLGSLLVPGVGPVLAAGSLGVALVTSVGGEGISAAATGRLVQELQKLGAPENVASQYIDRLHLGDYLVLIAGNDAELEQAGAILGDRGMTSWNIYAAPQAQ